MVYGMLRRRNILLILVVLLFATPVAIAQTVVVNGTGDGDYVSINNAIINADADDTIRVMPGIYTEHINVDKQVNLIAEGDVIVRPISAKAHTFHITEDNVIIDGFCIERDDIPFGSYDSGICLNNVHNVTVTNNVVSGHTYGIYLDISNDNVLDNNLVSTNVDGIYLHGSSDNTLRNNKMQSNLFNFGAYAYNGELNNDIDTSNTVNGKPVYYFVNQSDIVLDSSTDCETIYCIECTNISISDQTISDNVYGLFLYNAQNIMLDNITISNTRTGIYLFKSNNILLNNNTISGNIFEGINLMESNNNMIVNNTLNDHETGFNLYYSSDNLVYNNLFNNTVNVVSEGSTNTWNTTLTNTTNIAGSLWVGGNVWCNPNGTGFSQRSDDWDRNNISDISYSIANDGSDELPVSVSPHKFSLSYLLKSLVGKILSLF